MAKPGSCDSCGKTRPLTFVNWCGVDAYACWECRGGEPDEDDDDMFDGDEPEREEIDHQARRWDYQQDLRKHWRPE